MKVLGKYKNGNYKVYLLEDGTKVRASNSNEEDMPEFPENIDCKITNRCNVGCSYCYEGSKPNDEESDLLGDNLIKFISSLVPGTEIALGGGGLSTVKDLSLILNLLNNRGIISNCTFNQLELKSCLSDLKYFMEIKLIKGLGISFKKRNDPMLESLVKKYPNRVVIHVINGICTKEDFDYLKSLNCKVLILGYKSVGRGTAYEELMKNHILKIQNETESNILEYMKSFKSLSFDTLALKQLNIKDKVSKDVWDRCYLGDDGKYTMYVDLVKNKFAKNSIQPEENRYDIPESYNIRDMFKVIRRKECNVE